MYVKKYMCIFLCIYIVYLFDASHSDRREMVPHCGFDLHFPDNE